MRSTITNMNFRAILVVAIAFFIGMIPEGSAATIILTYEPDNFSHAAIKFTNTNMGIVADYSYFDDSDLGFNGIDNKAEGMKLPLLYTSNLDGRIIPKSAIALTLGSALPGNCADFSLAQYLGYDMMGYGAGLHSSGTNKNNNPAKEAEIEVGKSFCILTKDKANIVELNILNLSGDWKDVTIEWKHVLELQGKQQETQQSVQQGGQQDVRQEEQQSQQQGSTLLTSSNAAKKTVLNIVLFSAIIILSALIVFLVQRLSPRDPLAGIKTAREHFSVDGYCAKCKKRIRLKNPDIVLKKGRSFIEGECPKCGSSITRVKEKAEEKEENIANIAQGFCSKCNQKVLVRRPIRVILNSDPSTYDKTHDNTSDKISDKISDKTPDKTYKELLHGNCVRCGSEIVETKTEQRRV